MQEIIETKIIENMIYEIRGTKIMLDSDLAKLYHVETKRINEAVKNNPKKFPERYSWKLTDNESKLFLVENFDQKIEKRGGKYKNPRVFTEQGIYMLATIIKSNIATEITLNIMDTFVLMKKYVSSNIITNETLLNHETRIIKLENIFDKMSQKEKINTIFFDGQIFDAYSLLMDILNKAKEEIIIIDNYAGKELLDILKDINIKIIIISSNISNTLKTKYNQQYTNITFINNNLFHDRFIIIDRKKMYSCGASFKDLGKKCFALNEIDSTEIINILINKI